MNRRWITSSLPLATALLFSLLSTDANAETDQTTPEGVETRVNEKLNARLSLFLEQAEYRVLVTAKVRQYRQKILLEGETEKLSSGRERLVDSASGQLLPGFQRVEGESEVKPQDVNRKERAKYSYRSRTDLETVNVKVIIEETLPENAKELARETVGETLALTVGDTATYEVVELALVPQTADTSVWGWFSSYLNERGGSAIDLLYLGLLAVAIVFSFLAVVFYFREKKRRAMQAEKAASRRAKDVADSAQIEDICSEKLDELIEMMTRYPLIARNFLRNLADADKAIVFSTIRTPAMQNYFQNVLGARPAAVKKSSTDTQKAMTRVLRDLQRYVRLSKEMENKPFGFVSQLTGRQLAECLEGDSNRVDTLKVIAPYMADFQVTDVARNLTVDEKSAFLFGLRDHNGNLKVDQDADSTKRRATVEERLRVIYQQARAEAAVDVAPPEVFESSFLEGDRESVAVIKKLAAQQGTVPRAYEKYLINFEDFLGLDMGIARRVLKRVSNETLTKALIRYSNDKRMTELLGDMRSQLIESLKQREDAVSDTDIETAQDEVLRQYRRMV